MYIGKKLVQSQLYLSILFYIYSCYLCIKKENIEIEKIKSNGWEQHAEILSLAIQNSTIHYEVPISYSGRTLKALNSKAKVKIKKANVVSIMAIPFQFLILDV